MPRSRAWASSLSSSSGFRSSVTVMAVPFQSISFGGDCHALVLSHQELRTAAVALHRSTESVGAEAEVGWRETRRGQFCRRRDGRGAKNGERDYPKSPREERGSHRLRE